MSRTEKTKSNELNKRQQTFVEAYCTNGFNATKAAIAAGYSKRSAEMQGSRLMSNDKISAQVDKFKREASERALVTTEDVVKGLLIEAQTNGEGSTQSARVAAWKALSEYTGGFDANKQKVEHSGGIDLNSLSDEQLESRIRELLNG